MATVMLMHWPQINKDQYEQARKKVQWETNTPKGAKYHVAWFAEDGFHVLDVWESQADFERFATERLLPAVQSLGFQGLPNVKFFPVHASYAPNP